MGTVKRSSVLAIGAVVALSLVLRPGATTVGPVLAEISADLGLTPTSAGLITALPGLCFAIFGALAVRLAARAGLNATLAWAAVVIAAGLLARSWVSGGVSFFAFSVLACAGMGIGNVLVPAFIKRHYSHRPASLMTIYTTSLAIGATAGAASAAPIAHAVPGGWRASLGGWGLVALAAALPWAWLALNERRKPTGHVLSGGTPGALWRSPKAVALGIFFGVQSTQAYVQFGWLAQMFRDGGVPQTDAGLLVALISILGIPAGLAMPALVAKLPDLRPIIVAFGVLLVAGYAGVWLAPTHLPWLWATFLGLSGFAFPTALALITARTRDHHVTAQVSGFVQAVGYTLAAAGPFIVGALFDLTKGWMVPLVALACSSVVMVASGLVAAAPGYIDDELPAA